MEVGRGEAGINHSDFFLNYVHLPSWGCPTKYKPHVVFAPHVFAVCYSQTSQYLNVVMELLFTPATSWWFCPFCWNGFNRMKWSKTESSSFHAAVSTEQTQKQKTPISQKQHTHTHTVVEQVTLWPHRFWSLPLHLYLELRGRGYMRLVQREALCTAFPVAWWGSHPFKTTWMCFSNSLFSQSVIWRLQSSQMGGGKFLKWQNQMESGVIRVEHIVSAKPLREAGPAKEEWQEALHVAVTIGKQSESLPGQWAAGQSLWAPLPIPQAGGAEPSNCHAWLFFSCASRNSFITEILWSVYRHFSLHTILKIFSRDLNIHVVILRISTQTFQFVHNSQYTYEKSLKTHVIVILFWTVIPATSQLKIWRQIFLNRISRTNIFKYWQYLQILTYCYIASPMNSQFKSYTLHT